MAAFNLPSSVQEAGYNARNNAAANLQDLASMQRWMFNAPSALADAVGGGIRDFGRGFLGGAPVPAAVAAPVAGRPVAAVPVAVGPPNNIGPTSGPPTDKSIAQYGALSPAARAVLGNIDTNGVVKNAPAPGDPNAAALKSTPNLMQLMAGYAASNGGKISLRAMDALAGAAQRGAAASAATQRAPSIADIAGAQALQLGNQLFNGQKEQAAQKGDNAGYLKLNQEHLEMLERLARARAVDPLGAYAYGQPDAQ